MLISSIILLDIFKHGTVFSRRMIVSVVLPNALKRTSETVPSVQNCFWCYIRSNLRVAGASKTFVHTKATHKKQPQSWKFLWTTCMLIFSWQRLQVIMACALWAGYCLRHGVFKYVSFYYFYYTLHGNRLIKVHYVHYRMEIRDSAVCSLQQQLYVNYQINKCFIDLFTTIFTSGSLDY